EVAGTEVEGDVFEGLAGEEAEAFGVDFEEGAAGGFDDFDVVFGQEAVRCGVLVELEGGFVSERGHSSTPERFVVRGRRGSTGILASFVADATGREVSRHRVSRGGRGLGWFSVFGWWRGRWGLGG